ncbi:MAG: hypothetical protein SH868_19555 [Bythopirellula sp.]|nr:hypothetical protein [Bythopirellula sp.]
MSVDLTPRSRLAMNEDSIVEEIRRIRSEYAAKFNHDIRAMVEDAKQRQLNDKRELVQLSSRPAQLQTAAE